MERNDITDLIRQLHETQSRRTDQEDALETVVQWQRELDSDGEYLLWHTSARNHRLNIAQYEAAEVALAQKIHESRRVHVEEFLRNCHISQKRLRLPEPTITTNERDLKPEHHFYPARIEPWSDFVRQRTRIWNLLDQSDQFRHYDGYPHVQDLEEVQNYLDKVELENVFWSYHQLSIESSLKTLTKALNSDDQLFQEGFEGEIDFVYDCSDTAMTADTAVPQMQSTTMQSTSLDSTIRCKPRGNRGPDFFCTHRTNKYSPKRKVMVMCKDEVPGFGREFMQIGLRGPINTFKDAIEPDHDNYDFLCTKLMAALISETYAYMIGVGITFGCYSTGGAVVFLQIDHIDPLLVRYYFCMPQTAYSIDEEAPLQPNYLAPEAMPSEATATPVAHEMTTLGQTFAFLLMAINTESPSQDWFIRANQNIERWSFDIQSIERKLLRSNLRPKFTPGAEERSSDMSETAREAAATDTETSMEEWSRTMRAQRRTVETSYFCTHKCLSGVIYQMSMDPKCPNAARHGPQHLAHAEFLHLVRQHLHSNVEQSCTALYMQGATGSLLKIRLAGHGYVFLGKGVVDAEHFALRHEASIYQQLLPVQGKAAPVYLGLVDLEPQPFYLGLERPILHLMLLSWAGQSLDWSVDGLSREVISRGLEKAIDSIHACNILHHDISPRNVVIDRATGSVMIIDFDRAWNVGPVVLGTVQRGSREGHGHPQWRLSFAGERAQALAAVAARWDDS